MTPTEQIILEELTRPSQLLMQTWPEDVARRIAAALANSKAPPAKEWTRGEMVAHIILRQSRGDFCYDFTGYNSECIPMTLRLGDAEKLRAIIALAIDTEIAAAAKGERERVLNGLKHIDDYDRFRTDTVTAMVESGVVYPAKEEQLPAPAPHRKGG